MLKRVVSLIVGIACLVSMTSAFAASYTGTTTEYTADGKIKVVSTITSSAANEVATYLVHNAESVAAVTGADIVWADQYTFATAGETKTFSYVTSADNIGAPIVVGASATAAAGAEDEIPEVAKRVVVTCGDATWTVSIPVPDAENGYCKIPFDAQQSVVKAVTINGEVAADWFTAADAIWVPAALLTEDNNAVDVTAEGVVSAVSTKKMTFIAADAEAEGDDVNASVVVLANVVGDVDDFGILMAKSKEDAEAFIAGEAAEAYALNAWAKNSDGDYAVRVYDDTNFADYETVYAIAYYVADGVTYYADYGKFAPVE